MAEMKTLNGYEVVDAAARAEIELLKAKEPDLTGYATETYVNNAIPKLYQHTVIFIIDGYIDASGIAYRTSLTASATFVNTDATAYTTQAVLATYLSSKKTHLACSGSLYFENTDSNYLLLSMFSEDGSVVNFNYLQTPESLDSYNNSNENNIQVVDTVVALN